MSIALVTGGSTGLGAAFAHRLAADGHDLVLVARDRSRLDAAAARLRREHGVAVEVLVADLSEPAALASVERRLDDRDRPIDLLVNNAGMECDGEFADADVADLQAEIDLNVTAVMRLTRAALPGMTGRGRGAVVNVASFAGYLPARGSAYGATKAWVLAFTDTVAASLVGTGVHIVAVCAGRMRTGAHPEQESSAAASRLASVMLLQPEAVVRRCLDDLARGRSLSTPGLVYRGVVGVLELPRRSLRVAAKLAGRSREQRARPEPPAPHLELARPAA